MNVIGKQVRALRSERNLTQDGLCAYVASATLGSWVPTWRDIQRIEYGRRVVSDFELVGLAAALQVEIMDLLGVLPSDLRDIGSVARTLFGPVAQGEHAKETE